MTDIPTLISDLRGDEGFRTYLYDDATGDKIVPGYLCQGHPTAGFGFALDVAPLTMDESLLILTGRATSAVQALAKVIPWITNLTEPRQRALGNMSYNLGVAGLLKFTQFLGFMQAGQFDQAADDLALTSWYRQVGQRGVRIVTAIREG